MSYHPAKSWSVVRQVRVQLMSRRWLLTSDSGFWHCRTTQASNSSCRLLVVLWYICWVYLADGLSPWLVCWSGTHCITACMILTLAEIASNLPVYSILTHPFLNFCRLLPYAADWWNSVKPSCFAVLVSSTILCANLFLAPFLFMILNQTNSIQ